MGAYIHLGMFTEKLTQNEIIAILQFVSGA